MLSKKVFPNAYILGAPKCGTTSLSYWLSQHKQIFVPVIKEPHYFYSPYGPAMSEDDYLSLYADAPIEATVHIDASVWYLFSKYAVDKILKKNPNAKFIVCLRNPSDMFVSLHSENVYNGREKILDVEKAWQLNSRRRDGVSSGVASMKDGDVTYLAYDKACAIGTQIQRLVEKVPRSKIHFVLLDDIICSPHDKFLELCRFLEVAESVENISLARQNVARRPKSVLLNRILFSLAALKNASGLRVNFGVHKRIKKANTLTQKNDDVSEDLRRKVRAKFWPEVEKIESILDRDLSHWY